MEKVHEVDGFKCDMPSSESYKIIANSFLNIFNQLVPIK